MYGAGACYEALVDDAQVVGAAAQRLRLSERQLFQRAFEVWFGRLAGERELEPAFTAYLHRREVPYWVRHLARQVAAEPPSPPGTERPPVLVALRAGLTPDPKQLGLMDVMLVILFVGMGLGLLGF